MGQRLLIVDNDRAFLAEQRVTLESAFEVEVLGSLDSDSLLARVEAGGIAAVLICVEVSENKGYAFCSNLRKLQAQRPGITGVKIALISAKATEEEYKRHQSLKGRADLYLHKPIPPAALVAALGPVVPPRPVDPHNPLGDLADPEPDDLFSDLQNLEVDRLFDTPSAVTQRLEAESTGFMPLTTVKTAPPHTTHADLAQAQIEALAQQLQQREEVILALQARAHAAQEEGEKHFGAATTAAADREALKAQLKAAQEESFTAHSEALAARAEAQAARQELQQVQRAMDSATRNLEEMEQRQQNLDQLHAELAESQAALKRLEGSGTDLEALKNQLRNTLEEKQEHLHQIEALNQQTAEKAQKIVELLRDRDRLQTQALELEPFKALAEQARREAAELREAGEAARAEAEESLAALRTEQKEMKEALRALADRHEALESAHGAAKADLQEREARLTHLQEELSGMEATLRGQGRELAGLQEKLPALESEAERLREELATKQANLEKMGNEIFAISAQRNDLQQKYEDCAHAREQERMELMRGLDEKEAELHRRQETVQRLEREKQALEGQMAERNDRMASLGALLEEAAERLRKASELNKG